MTTIRPAVASDAAALAKLRWEFRSDKNPPVESRDAFIARCESWMRHELTTGSSWRAWLAEHDGEVVGQVWVHLIHKVPNPAGDRERHMYLSNLYVRHAARGGVGTRLLDAALDWAASEHVDRVVLWPTDRSRPLYQRRGFTSDVDLLELNLERSRQEKV